MRGLNVIKLQDFARDCGVTDRAIQKHIKNHEEDLQGHIERRGKNGTWIDEYAEEYIRGLMKTAPVVVGDNAQLRKIDELEQKIDRLYGYIEKKDDFINRMMEAAAVQQKRIENLESQKLLIEERTEKKIIDVRKELEASHRAAEKQQSEEIERLRQELDREKNRPLTLKERLTGKRQV